MDDLARGRLGRINRILGARVALGRALTLTDYEEWRAANRKLPLLADDSGAMYRQRGSIPKLERTQRLDEVHAWVAGRRLADLARVEGWDPAAAVATLGDDLDWLDDMHAQETSND